ncbi:MAG TPA: S-methyl-5-thioribose-1-phosphate isomerase [Thermotogota bacterium]|nr:S-methyl-5-thioribose-1-phosphate isomerase [Thermotogota bacterium]
MKKELLPLIFKNDHLDILDQRELPTQIVYNRRKTLDEVFCAIRDMELRGAPLIGITAAYGMYLSILDFEGSSDDLLRLLDKNGEYLVQARPTAVNLDWAIKRMTAVAQMHAAKGIDELKKELLSEALLINNEDIQICKNIGENLLTLLEKGSGLLTHCNAGALATYKYGTATAPMYLGHERGWGFKIYADETRPYNQGARLTAFELSEAGMDVTLICDNMAGVVMSQGKIDAVIVGCDRVAANGDAANKIGTMTLSVLAKEFHIPFYIAAPTPTIDLATVSGNDIPIEERSHEEITMFKGQQVAPLNISVYNPAFDVTPSENITAIVTEKGIVYPPYSENLSKLMKG